MAPFGKKATYIAPGKIGSTRAQGFKATFLPGVVSKEKRSTPSDDPNMSNSNEGVTNKAPRKEMNPLPRSLIESLNEDIHEDDMVQRSINNAELSRFIDENASENDPNMLEEDATVAVAKVTQKRNRKPDAKSRGVNKCKNVANLKQGEKLQVDFYNVGPVGKYQRDLTRHMGKLVRDRTICPVRIHSWDEIEQDALEHMWQSVLNKFDGKGIPLDRNSTIKHMKRLWQNWRGILMQNSIKKKGGPENALKETPNDFTPEDWQWLVKEHFMKDEFKKVSSRNSGNRENLTMPHRTGSMPFKQVIWEDMGVKEGKDPPPISAIFKRTPEGKSRKLAEIDAAKYDEIVVVEKDNPSLSTFDVVEKCFGEQDRGSVVCFGFGVRPMDVRGPLPSRADLTSRLHEKERENVELRRYMEDIEKARQEERDADAKKINSLFEKIDFLLDAYHGFNGGNNAN